MPFGRAAADGEPVPQLSFVRTRPSPGSHPASNVNLPVSPRPPSALPFTHQAPKTLRMRDRPFRCANLHHPSPPRWKLPARRLRACGIGTRTYTAPSHRGNRVPETHCIIKLGSRFKQKLCRGYSITILEDCV